MDPVLERPSTLASMSNMIPRGFYVAIIEPLSYQSYKCVKSQPRKARSIPALHSADGTNLMPEDELLASRCDTDTSLEWFAREVRCYGPLTEGERRAT